MKLRAFALIALLAVAGAAAACGDGAAGSPSASAEPLPTVDTSLLVGSWTLDNINGEPLPPGTSASIELGPDGTVSGSSGCNTFNGTYEAGQPRLGSIGRGETLYFSELATTRMACEEPQMTLETTVLEALASVSGFRWDDAGRLELWGGTTLVYSPA